MGAINLVNFSLIAVSYGKIYPTKHYTKQGDSTSLKLLNFNGRKSEDVVYYRMKWVRSARSTFPYRTRKYLANYIALSLNKTAQDQKKSVKNHVLFRKMFGNRVVLP